MNVIMRELTEKKNTVEVNRVVQERHQFVGQNERVSILALLFQSSVFWILVKWLE